MTVTAVERRWLDFRERPFRNCLENREGGISAVLFDEVRRQNRPSCLSCRLMEVPGFLAIRIFQTVSLGTRVNKGEGA
jgi:hypothetical protein